MGGLFKTMVDQGELDGMRPKKIVELEKLCLVWRDDVASHKEATTAVTKSKENVRVFVAEYNDGCEKEEDKIKAYFVEGHGTVNVDEPEWDISWKGVKRKEQGGDVAGE